MEIGWPVPETGLLPSYSFSDQLVPGFPVMASTMSTPRKIPKKRDASEHPEDWQTRMKEKSSSI
jgi:hypothetical protein